MIRDEIKELLALGPLPSEETATEEQLRAIDRLLAKTMRPVTDEEARALVTLFQYDDSLFGLAWTLLHLIETAPNCPVTIEPLDSANEWIKRFWRRDQRGKNLGMKR